MKNVFVAAMVAVSVMSSVSFAEDTHSKTTTETTTQQSAPAAATTGHMDTTADHAKMDHKGHKMSGKMHKSKSHKKTTTTDHTESN